MRHHPIASSFVATCLVALLASSTSAQTPLDTSFKFQGELRLSNVVVNTNQDFIFDVYGVAAGGATLGTNNRPSVPVTRGVFTVTLDFGAGIFDGDKRWVGIRVRDTGAGGAYTTLSPRVELNAVPNALFAAAVGPNSVESEQIVNFSIKPDDIQAGAVGPSKIVNGAISNVKLSDNAVTSVKIQDGTIVAADIAAGAIGSSKIATGAVSSAKIQDGSIAAVDVAPNIVSSLSGVSNDGGNIALVAGNGMSITPNDAANTITFSTSANANTLDGIDSAQFLRSDVADAFSGGTLSFQSGSNIVAAGSSPNTLTIGGANLELSLGDSGADIVTVPGPFSTNSISPLGTILTLDASDLRVGNTATSTIFFFEEPSSTFAHRIAWEDPPLAASAQLASCTTTGAISSAFIFDVADGTSSGWAFTNGSDAEMIIDEIGAVTTDSSVSAGAGCDLAEAFLGPDGLEPGTLLRTDPTTPEAILPTRRAYDPTMVGVVSTVPAFRMAGGTAGVLPVVAEMMRTRDLLRANPNDADLERRFQDLELAVDTWPRGNVDVALVGRVPVKVIGPVRAGEPLTSSDVLGHAMALDRPGPSIGIALDESDGTRGTVLVLLQPGWREPLSLDEERETVAQGEDAKGGAGQSLQQRVAHLEKELLALAGRRGRDGSIGHDGVDGRDGRTDGRTDGSGSSDGIPGEDVRSIVRLHDEEWGDFDGDGLNDVAVIDPRRGVKLLRNRGDGSFADVTHAAGLGDTVGTRLARWTDYDVDRRLDLLLVDAAGVAHLFQGAGTGVFTEVTDPLGLDFGQPIVEASFLDYDHDGLDDLRVELADGTIVLHHNLGQGVFQAVSLRQPVATDDVDRAQGRIADLESQVSELKGLVLTLLAERAESER